MRDLRFRAWDKNKSRMFRVEEIDFRYRKAGEKHGLEYFDWKDLEIMQYTGLKDKNGIEIYEGDVVTYTDHSGSDDKSWNFQDTIKWCDGAWYPRPLKEDCGDSYYDLHRYNFEVIGNIHENPELL